MSKKDIVQKGDSLLEEALAGDLNSAYEYMVMVYNGEYSGNAERSGSKAAAVREIGKYSEMFLLQAAEAGHKEAMIKAAEIYRVGARIPGYPVTILFEANYKTALMWHEKVLERDDIDPEKAGELHSHAGRLAWDLHKGKGEFDINIAIEHLKAAVSHEGEGALIGCSIYGRYLHQQKEYEAALPLLERAAPSILAAAGLAASMHEKGQGTAVNPEKALEFMRLFHGE